MRLSGSTIFGFILAIGITLIQPYLAFGAAQSFGRAGSSGASRMQGQRPFNRFGFFGVDGLGDQGDEQIIIIQQYPPAPTAKPSEPAENKIYVQPRWVDGGYGVEVLTARILDRSEASGRELIRRFPNDKGGQT